MTNHQITGELADFRDAISRVPRYARALQKSVKRLSVCLDKIADGPRFLRWLPFRIVPARCLSELMVRADQVDNDATKIAFVGYFIAESDAAISNPWSATNGKS